MNWKKNKSFVGWFTAGTRGIALFLFLAASFSLSV